MSTYKQLHRILRVFSLGCSLLLVILPWVSMDWWKAVFLMLLLGLLPWLYIVHHHERMLRASRTLE